MSDKAHLKKKGSEKQMTRYYTEYWWETRFVSIYETEDKEYESHNETAVDLFLISYGIFVSGFT